jgi:hypothetical protein
MVTVFNLQRQGASESLLYETRRIFSILQKLDIRITVTHLPGKENVTADALSRMDLVGDYELKKEVYEAALEKLGVWPTLDAFANCNNHKCDRFWALPGPLSVGAEALDAMRYDWSEDLVYLFPPVQLVPKVLQKLVWEGGDAIMVVPDWPSRPWWNMMQSHRLGQVSLGEAEVALRPGPSLAVNRARLPPGNFLMVLLSSEQ